MGVDMDPVALAEFAQSVIYFLLFFFFLYNYTYYSCCYYNDSTAGGDASVEVQSYVHNIKHRYSRRGVGNGLRKCQSVLRLNKTQQMCGKSIETLYSADSSVYLLDH